VSAVSSASSLIFHGQIPRKKKGPGVKQSCSVYFPTFEPSTEAENGNHLRGRGYQCLTRTTSIPTQFPLSNVLYLYFVGVFCIWSIFLLSPARWYNLVFVPNSFAASSQMTEIRTSGSSPLIFKSFKNLLNRGHNDNGFQFISTRTCDRQQDGLFIAIFHQLGRPAVPFRVV
jgi:hypothetical protein